MNSHRMWCARWDTGTGQGVKLQPLTLGFFKTDARARAARMGGDQKSGFELVEVDVTMEVATCRSS